MTNISPGKYKLVPLYYPGRTLLLQDKVFTVPDNYWENGNNVFETDIHYSTNTENKFQENLTFELRMMVYIPEGGDTSTNTTFEVVKQGTNDVVSKWTMTGDIGSHEIKNVI